MVSTGDRGADIGEFAMRITRSASPGSALAIVRREAANGQQVTVGDGGVTAELVELPFPT